MNNGDDVGNIHFVDSFTTDRDVTNYLFRGGSPVNDDYTFNISGLLSGLSSAARKANIKLPEEYQIYDINLQQWENPGEVPQIETEYNYFQQNSGKGNFDFWETKGTALCPFDEKLSGESVEHLARQLDDWLPDTLVKRTQALRDALTGAWEPTVIYVHCSGGQDRTGEMIGAYYLRWMNMSWEAMNIKNTQSAGRPFGCNNFRATLWYAMYLYFNFGFPTDYKLPFECTNGKKPEYACTEKTLPQ